jgi:hypothetical protein
MRFKKGQKVVCVKKEPWVIIVKRNQIYGYPDPKYNEVVTVKRYVNIEPGVGWLIELFEYGFAVYSERNFEPLIEDSVLEKELSEIPEVVW